MSLVTLPSPEILNAVCRKNGIARLSLFGSAVREDFEPGRSDVDLLVEYEEGKHPELDHFRIADELEALFGAKVDLNTPAMLGRFAETIALESEHLYGEA